MPRPVLLVVMDGVGINPRKEANAVVLARKPFLEKMWERYPVTRIKTSGEDVGLPDGVMGNSEVGHLNIGAGRVVYQPFTRINKAIREKTFASNPEIQRVFSELEDGTLHLMGLLSTGGVHGDIGHVEAILDAAAAAGLKKVVLHPFLDGRDMPPRSGVNLVRRLEEKIAAVGIGRIASLSGRYYAMDRDRRWDRTAKAYEVIVEGRGRWKPNAIEAVEESYSAEVTDEFLLPVRIGPSEKEAGCRIEEGDAVFFWNFRPDRARQMTRALMDPEFDGFARERFPRIHYLGMVVYDENFPLPAAFPPEDLHNVLAQVLSDRGLKQFHTAETEKYAHVTFFLNGGREDVFPGEDRKLIPSPKVATYDLQPEMSAPGVTEAVLEALDRDYDFIIVNYANGDMVGHTGILEAAIRAVEAVDAGVSQIVPKVLEKGGVALVTADHGNAEQMIWYETGEPHTQHTTYDVTFTVCGAGDVSLRSGGRLADIAPTILALLGIEKPPEMTGENLIMTP
ncbi:MAG: 2,3-bisphosphoglycerate-independent phosphoglycerate mutase [Candidatus Hydrogenedentota bacterium]|nr:MAG: 2,3-bisphosphoglycerate-independent phosphoglycerate mutase [Candidatus Hydrogenedentota bacterium]